ncbi:MAG: serine/threonine protein kinase [Planctomycetes bacterium]|nr:serine/threonine protein kinase [Planctomycetota bacterium]
MEAQISTIQCEASNRYVLEEQIDAGGMGKVYRALDVQLKRHVALKILNTLDQDSIERFVREREITADLDHPSFVRIFSMGYLSTPDGRRPFYTMPLLRGQTLASLISSRVRPDAEGERLREEFTLTRLLQLVQQLCMALESAHDRGIIHRDIKPANVVVGTYGEAYIVDLGLAKYVHESGTAAPDEADTDAGEAIADTGVVGTPFFIAPEQVLHPARVDARTDIFGLGAVLYNVLTGHPPLYRRSPETSRRRGRRPPTQVPSGPWGTPPAFRNDDASAHPSSFFGASSRDSSLTNWSSTPSRLFQRTLRGVLVPPDEFVARLREEIDASRLTDLVLEPVDAALSAICVKALARKPEDRYPNCRAMWLELQQYLEGHFEMIFSREAKELTRRMSHGTLPAALCSYELAERGIRQRIFKEEIAGRLVIEEKLDLLDVFLEKAKIYERRGDSASIIRAAMRTEPLIETALEILHRQYVRLLIAKGTAQLSDGAHAAAKEIFGKAMELSRAHVDLLATASWGYGAAGADNRNSTSLARARKAFRDSIDLADRAGAVAQGVRSRVSLARLCIKSRPPSGRDRTLLEEALRLAGQDVALLCEVHLAFGAFQLACNQASEATRHVTLALQHAEEMDAPNLGREAHFLLGQACHAVGDAVGRVKHFRLALHVRGTRRVIMEREIAAFYARYRLLDPQEIGLRIPPSIRRSNSSAPL